MVHENFVQKGMLFTVCLAQNLSVLYMVLTFWSWSSKQKSELNMRSSQMTALIIHENFYSEKTVIQWVPGPEPACALQVHGFLKL